MPATPNQLKTILLVEDFTDARQMMKYLLEDLGYSVLEATDGWQAVEAVKREKPDLILMDMALPQISGLSATRIIRQMKEAAQTPIIALTASGQYIYRQAIEAGCDDLLEKPLDVDRLQPIIEKYLPSS